MTIRRTYQFNTNSSILRDGILLNNTCDIHGRALSDYSLIPYMLDLTMNDRLLVGDRVGLNTNSASLPLQIGGGLHAYYKTIDNGDSPYTVTADDCILLIDSSGGVVTVNFPASANVPGKLLFVKVIDSGNNITFDGNGAETIDGLTTLVVSEILKTIIFLCDGSNWHTLSVIPKKIELLSDFIPSATTTSGSYSTVDTSPATVFSGRDVMFFLNGSMRNNNGADEFMQVYFALRFDAGVDTRVCEWAGNFADNHANYAGVKILTPPSAGSHTVSLRWLRNAGAGTATIDNNDWYTLSMIEV